MLKKGLINSLMTEEEMQDYLEKACNEQVEPGKKGASAITKGSEKTPVKTKRLKQIQDDEASEEKQLTPEQQADQVVRDAENSKAKLLEVAGNVNNVTMPQSELLAHNRVSILSTAQIDEDYQMVDSHVEDGLKTKIQNFEYVDFVKLLTKNHLLREDKQRLEIVTKDGMTFLSPVVDRENQQINSYHKWEQAFRVFSNILTTKYPNKATELFQYGHIIKSAASAYIWENVYSYDKEF